MPFLASMGIYVIKGALLKELLDSEADANDFGSEVIPMAKEKGHKIQAFLFDGYWEDIGTIEAFYNANLALTETESPKFRSVHAAVVRRDKKLEAGALTGNPTQLISCLATCSFYDRKAPIYTMSRFLPPSKVLDAMVSKSIIGDGCVIRSNTTITHSVIGLRALIGEALPARCAVSNVLTVYLRPPACMHPSCVGVQQFCMRQFQLSLA